VIHFVVARTTIGIVLSILPCYSTLLLLLLVIYAKINVVFGLLLGAEGSTKNRIDVTEGTTI